MAKFPPLPLKDAVETIEKLFTEIQRTEVDGVTASKALGYSGENGAARTKLGALNSYGLIDRGKKMVKVTELGISIAHPLGDSRQKGVKEAALKPLLFKEIWDNHRQCSESVLASTLVHKGYDAASAAQAAKIFKGNVAFASLGDGDYSPKEKPSESQDNKDRQIEKPANMLAEYAVPLGANEAKIVFTGQQLSPDDFDALIEYVTLFKQQFERRTGTAPVKSKGDKVRKSVDSSSDVLD